MDELKSLNLTLGFYFFLNLKNLNSDFLGFLGFLKKPKKPRFFKAMSNSPAIISLPAGLRVAQPCRYCFYLVVQK